MTRRMLLGLKTAGRSTRGGVRRRFGACRIETHAAFSTDARHDHGSFIEGVMQHTTPLRRTLMAGGWLTGLVVVGGTMEFTVSEAVGPRFLEGVPKQSCMRKADDAATVLQECLSRGLIA
jgi:hypothetical protein